MLVPKIQAHQIMSTASMHIWRFLFACRHVGVIRRTATACGMHYVCTPAYVYVPKAICLAFFYALLTVPEAYVPKLGSAFLSV
jgi:hypothetical protein